MFRRKLRKALIRLGNAVAALRGHPVRKNVATLHAVIKQEGDWYVGWVEEIPGANSQGRTIDEVLKNLREAVIMIVESNRDDARSAVKDQDVRHETFTVAV